MIQACHVLSVITFLKTGHFCRMALVCRWAVENNCFSRVMNFKYIISSAKTLSVLFSQFPLSYRDFYVLRRHIVAGVKIRVSCISMFFITSTTSTGPFYERENWNSEMWVIFAVRKQLFAWAETWILGQSIYPSIIPGILIFLFWDHTHWCSKITFGSALRNPGWLEEAYGMPRIKSGLTAYKANTLFTAPQPWDFMIFKINIISWLFYLQCCF